MPQIQLRPVESGHEGGQGIVIAGELALLVLVDQVDALQEFQRRDVAMAVGEETYELPLRLRIDEGIGRSGLEAVVAETNYL